MTVEQAKACLLLHRPWLDAGNDPALDEALNLCHQDPELSRWYEEHCAAQEALRTRLRQIQPPTHLKSQLLASRKVVRLPIPTWTRVALAAAAAVALLLGLAPLWRSNSASRQLKNFETRMVSSVLRDYRMDIETNDLQQVRKYLARNGGPADYELPAGLANLKLTGGGRLTWRSHPVSMLCFDRGAKGMLYLFVAERSSFEEPPPVKPASGKAVGLQLATWSRGDKSYFLAGNAEPDFNRKYVN